MSIHIEMDEDNFSQITTYHGTLDEKYSFIVELSYNTNRVGYNIDSIEFIGCSEEKGEKYWKRSKDKIKDFVMKWLFEKSKEKKDE